MLMIKVNKNLLIFVSLIVGLGASSILFLEKLIPFAKHTSYYCQSIINSFSIPKSHFLGMLPFILLSLFALIACIKLLFLLIRVRILKRNVVHKRLKKLSLLLHKHKLIDTTYLINSKKHFAFCLGIKNPKIYISTGMVTLLSVKELEIVLLHEKYHMDNNDTLTTLVASIGESLLPFFPILSDLLYNYRIEREIRADAKAIETLGIKKPLLSALKKLLSSDPVSVIPSAAIADQDTLELRILKLTKRKVYLRKYKIQRVMLSIVSAALISAVAFSPVYAVEVHHDGQDVMMICSGKDSCFNSCREEYPYEREVHRGKLLYSPAK